MNEAHKRILLFIHVICITAGRKPLLNKPVLAILSSFIKKNAEEKGIKVLIAQGAEDHLHLLVQLHSAQNLLQVVRSIQKDSAEWLNGTTLVAGGFDWEPEFAAYSVSPSGVKQVIEFLNKQEEYHKTKTLESELAVFDTNYIQTG